MFHFVCARCGTDTSRNTQVGSKIRFCHDCWFKHHSECLGIIRGKPPGRRSVGAGYVQIHCPTHPHATTEGYVAEHRLVMENALGFFLEKHETVHHINGILDDNRLDNLDLFTSRGNHVRHHLLGRERPQQVRQKVKEGLKDYYANHHSIGLGVPRSEEVKQKIRDTKRLHGNPRWGVPRTQQERQNIKEGLRRRKEAMRCQELV